MDSEVDMPTIIMQLQLENELLRHQMRSFLQVRSALQPLIELAEKLWQRVSKDKMSLLVTIMALYWLVQTVLAIYDRVRANP